MQRGTYLLTGLLLAAMTGLGAADVLLLESIPGAAQPAEERTTEDRTSASSLSSLSSAQTSQASLTSTTSTTSSSPTSSISPVDVTPPPSASSIPPPPPGAVRKFKDRDVLQTASALGFTVRDTEEKTFLSAVVQGDEAVTARTLLLDGDRAGLLVWIETPLVKQVFMVLKESLHSLFSTQVRDLLDETQTIPGKPTRNFLTFFDPQMSEERLVFVRIRERLFEFHIAPDKEDAMYKLVEALTE